MTQAAAPITTAAAPVTNAVAPVTKAAAPVTQAAAPVDAGCRARRRRRPRRSSSRPHGSLSRSSKRWRRSYRRPPRRWRPSSSTVGGRRPRRSCRRSRTVAAPLSSTAAVDDRRAGREARPRRPRRPSSRPSRRPPLRSSGRPPETVRRSSGRSSGPSAPVVEGRRRDRRAGRRRRDDAVTAAVGKQVTPARCQVVRVTSNLTQARRLRTRRGRERYLGPARAPLPPIASESAATPSDDPDAGERHAPCGLGQAAPCRRGAARRRRCGCSPHVPRSVASQPFARPTDRPTASGGAGRRTRREAASPTHIRGERADRRPRGAVRLAPASGSSSSAGSSRVGVALVSTSSAGSGGHSPSSTTAATVPRYRLVAPALRWRVRALAERVRPAPIVFPLELPG